MNILDLDMDFFLDDTCELALEGCRPDETEARPWDEQAVRDFLEKNCGLSKEHKIKGRIFDTHDKALDFWLENADFPIDVTHVDAHSDLGIGQINYVLDNVITLRPEIRNDIKKYRREEKLTEANYLLFALGMRLVGTLKNVRNPKSRPDTPVFCHDGYILLESNIGKLLPALDHHEPMIPYTIYTDWREIKADKPFDMASMAISPRYSPASADYIVDIFTEYIC